MSCNEFCLCFVAKMKVPCFIQQQFTHQSEFIPVMSCMRSLQITALFHYHFTCTALCSSCSFAHGFACPVARLAGDCINATTSTSAKIIVVFVTCYFALHTKTNWSWLILTGNAILQSWVDLTAYRPPLSTRYNSWNESRATFAQPPSLDHTYRICLSNLIIWVFTARIGKQASTSLT